MTYIDPRYSQKPSETYCILRVVDSPLMECTLKMDVCCWANNGSVGQLFLYGNTHTVLLFRKLRATLRSCVQAVNFPKRR